jgi:hypothetical protein
MLSFGQKLIHLIDFIMQKKYLNKSMVKYVKLTQETLGLCADTYKIFSERVLHYSVKLSLTPRLGHFIPCDENDVPLVKPEQPWQDSIMEQALHARYKMELHKYQKACDRVLFEGFYIDKMSNDVSRVKNLSFTIFWYNLFKKNEWSLSQGIMTYEDLIKYNFLLTDAGAKFFWYAND